jgi:hypothetical protein
MSGCGGYILILGGQPLTLQVDFMDRLGTTWMEAAKGRDILMALRAECQPQDGRNSVNDGEADHQGSPQQDLNDWLASHDLWSLMTTEPASHWGQAGLPYSIDPMTGM